MVTGAGFASARRTFRPKARASTLRRSRCERYESHLILVSLYKAAVRRNLSNRACLCQRNTPASLDMKRHERCAVDGTAWPEHGWSVGRGRGRGRGRLRQRSSEMKSVRLCCVATQPNVTDAQSNLGEANRLPSLARLSLQFCIWSRRSKGMSLRQGQPASVWSGLPLCPCNIIASSHAVCRCQVGDRSAVLCWVATDVWRRERHKKGPAHRSLLYPSIPINSLPLTH